MAPRRSAPKRERERPSRAWIGSLVLGALITATYFATSGTFRDALYDALRISAGVVAVVVVRRLAPARSRAWYLFGVGEILFGLGDVTWDIIASFGGEPFPSVADVCYVGGYACIIYGLLKLIRLCTGNELPALVDAGVAAAGVGMILWIAVFGPAFEDSSGNVLATAVSVSYPIMDLLLLVVAARLAMGGTRRTGCHYLLLAGVLLLIAADVGFSLAESGSGYERGSILDLFWLASSVFWTAAMLHPSMAAVGVQSDTSRRGLSNRRVAMLVLASLLGPGLLIGEQLRRPDRDLPVVVFGAVLLGLVWVRFAILVREHVRQRAVEHEVELRALSQAERHRVAREMHDFVTYSLGAVILQAGGARRLLATDAGHVDEALLALRTIEGRSREALEEMRGLLTVLRRDDGDDDAIAGLVARRPPDRAPVEAGLAASANGEAAPERTDLRDIHRLVEQARAAGLVVEVTLAGDLDSVPRACALAGFRIVQEALNNCCRHAAGSHARVEVRRAEPDLFVEITDDGGTGAEPVTGTAPEGVGYGLIGMKERVALVNGQIDAGPLAGGGWEVRATIPIAGKAAGGSGSRR